MRMMKQEREPKCKWTDRKGAVALQQRCTEALPVFATLLHCSQGLKTKHIATQHSFSEQPKCMTWKNERRGWQKMDIFPDKLLGNFFTLSTNFYSVLSERLMVLYVINDSIACTWLCVGISMYAFLKSV